MLYLDVGFTKNHFKKKAQKREKFKKLKSRDPTSRLLIKIKKPT